MISIPLIGGLGNQMFQYAICRTLAESNGYNFHILTTDRHKNELTTYFNLPMIGYCSDHRSVDNLSFKQHYYEDTQVQGLDSSLNSISDDTYLEGFFQTEKYFIQNRSNVEKWFTSIMDPQVLELFVSYPKEEYCYIHFRGGDYVDFDGGSRILPISYFHHAMTTLKEMYDNIKFVIITDDTALAKTYFPNEPVLSNSMMVDFNLLKHAKYSIISNSSFSWWARWLSKESVTVAPKRWLNYNMPDREYYPKDIYTEKFMFI